MYLIYVPVLQSSLLGDIIDFRDREIIKIQFCSCSVFGLWFYGLKHEIFFVYSDMKNLIGEALCRICQESFSMTVTGIYGFVYLF